jgi:hypothetical protein
MVQELLELTGTWKRRNSDIMKRKLTPARLFTVGPGVSGPAVTRVSLPGAGMGGGFNDDDDLDGLEKLTPEGENGI